MGGGDGIPRGPWLEVISEQVDSWNYHSYPQIRRLRPVDLTDSLNCEFFVSGRENFMAYLYFVYWEVIVI